MRSSLDARCPGCGSYATQVVRRNRIDEAWQVFVFFGTLFVVGVLCAIAFIPMMCLTLLGASNAAGEVMGDAIGERVEDWARRRGS